MDQTSESKNFFSNYDCIAVCGCFRFGSTALGQKLAQFCVDNGYRTRFLNEFFTMHHYLATNDENGLHATSLPMDFIPFGGDQRAIRSTMAARNDSIFRAKITWLRQNMSRYKLVLKLDPDDWIGSNGEMLEDFIFGNPRVYKLGLNRQDVGNAIISYLIGIHFGFWNFGSGTIIDEYDKTVKPVQIVSDDLQPMVDLLLLHNNWLWYMRDRLDGLVWHDQIEHLRLPGIGLISDIDSYSAKHPIPHEKRLQKYFINHEEVGSFAAAAQANLNELISEVRRRYTEDRPCD